jgi:membrane protease YdiL (CAAX protease family)
VDQPLRADRQEPAVIWLDHLLAGTIVLVDPVYGAWTVARVIRQIASGDPDARLRLYRSVIAWHSAYTIGLLVLWAWLDRPFAWLGLVAPAGRAAWISLALSVATLAFFATQIRGVLTSADARAAVRAELDRSGPGVQTMAPATARELKLFMRMSVTAGICEEILARGFMLWYFSAWLPWWAAIAAVIAVFGVGHAYQGLRGVLMTAAVGAIALAVYLWTGSLVAPIVIHAVIDLSNGVIGYRARQPEGGLTLA